MVKTPDLVTLGALGTVVYSVSALSHEGLGHGLTCAAVGGHVEALTSTYLQCTEGLPRLNQQAIEAAGTLVNLLFGAVALTAIAPRLSGWARAFWWLFGTVNILQGGGYLLVSPLAHFGDWNAFVEGVPFEWGWRIGLTALGAASSVWGARASGRLLASMVGGEADRSTRIRMMVWVPYAVGCATDIFAALFNPMGWELVLISSVGSAVFGTCWLVFMVPPIAKKAPSPATPVELERSTAWVVAAVLMLLVHVYVGHGLVFTH